jgi:hypothetical protein
VLISSKDNYNQGSPAEDVDPANPFVAEIIATLTGLHTALEDDFVDAGLTSCASGTVAGGDLDVTPCITQDVAPGVSVASLILPDSITIAVADADGNALTAGFPNGRLLTDLVVDITLAVLLLDLETHGAGGLVGLNPTANDVAFSEDFPYLGAPHDGGGDDDDDDSGGDDDDDSGGDDDDSGGD